MIGVKELCALLAAGGMGASGVVAVQQVKPVVHRAKPKPAPHVSRTAAPRPAAKLSDCPITASSLGGGALADLAPIAPFEQSPMASLSSPGMVGVGAGGGGLNLPPSMGGGGSGGSEFPKPGEFAPGVPEPAAWAMMVSGFGLVGVAMRRPRQSETAGKAAPAAGA